MSNSISCPHCGANNVAGAQFCESCGKALPSAVPSGPRVVSAESMPTTAIGGRLVSDELTKTQKKASGALLAVAILQTLVGPLLLVVITRNARPPVELGPVVWVVQFGVAALFWALWFWSRKSPLPASIVGLVLYCTLVVINVISSVSALAQNPDGPRRGFGGLGIGIIDVIIIVVLAQAIQAGLKHKRLVQSGALS